MNSLATKLPTCARLARQRVAGVEAKLSLRPFSVSRVAHGSSYSSDDQVVPDFYVQRKLEQDGPATGKEPSSLMNHLSDRMLSEKSAANIQRMKIPSEFFDENGNMYHASSPGHAPLPPSSLAPEDAAALAERLERELVAQTAAIAERVLEEDFSDIFAETTPRAGKVPFESRERDGSVAHPSGWIPPTPAHLFPASFMDHSNMVQPAPPRPEFEPPVVIQREDPRQAIVDRKDQGGMLMSDLTAHILTDGVSSTLETRDAKVPNQAQTGTTPK